MKYPKDQWLSKPDDIKIMTIKDELELVTHNGTTKDDLLMMLGWLFDQFEVTETEIKALTLEELRQMDGKPVYLQYGDGTEGWGIVCAEDNYMYFYGPDIEDNNEPDQDFYNMTCDDPDGFFGLHVLGWRAYDQPPGERVS